jgi:hypothetical protein
MFLSTCPLWDPSGVSWTPLQGHLNSKRVPNRAYFILFFSYFFSKFFRTSSHSEECVNKPRERLGYLCAGESLLIHSSIDIKNDNGLLQQVLDNANKDGSSTFAAGNYVVTIFPKEAHKIIVAWLLTA